MIHNRGRAPAAVRDIRARRQTGETVTAIARLHNINPANVSRIARGQWRAEVQ